MGYHSKVPEQSQYTKGIPKKRIVIFTDLGWSIERVFRDMETYLTDYIFVYHNATAFATNKLVADVNECHICISSLYLYNDMMHIFKSPTLQQKLVFMAHGFSEIQTQTPYSTYPTYCAVSDVLIPFMPTPMYVTPNGVDDRLYTKTPHSGRLRSLGWCSSKRMKLKRFEWAYTIADNAGLSISIASNLTFEHLREWYRTVDLFLVTSGPEPHVETGPLPPFEAIASGVPVIGTAVGNFRHVPGPKFTTMDDAVAILKTFKAHPERLQALADEQYAYVMANFTYAAVKKQWITMLDAVAEKQRAKRERKNVIFQNDNNIRLTLLESHPFTETFVKRDDHEVIFRRIHSYLIQKQIIKGNIIDLGAWMGDNSLPWAKQTPATIYAIDPSPQNIQFIRDMCAINEISNIKTIQTPVSDKNERVTKNGHINHCSFVEGGDGATGMDAVSLDFLYDTKQIERVGFIHLDVEGFEERVVRGAERLLRECRPIVTFEQHLTIDDYMWIVNHLEEKRYDVYLIHEVLPGCRSDCRNILAFPRELCVNISEIHAQIGKPILLLLSKSSEELPRSPPRFSATLFGSYITKEYPKVGSIKDASSDAYLFAIHDKEFTKIVAIREDGTWIDGRYVMGLVNLSCPSTVSHAYALAQGIFIDRTLYNYKDTILSAES
jgi:FkbM family methyltransferase